MRGVAVAAAVALLVAAAIGRQAGLQALSPPDLAFFAQSAWSAVHAGAFAQTVLSFDDGGLLTSVHLSPIVLLYAAILRLGGGLSALVGVQALALASSGLAAARIARAAGGSPAVGLLALLHPFTIALAVDDLRPLCLLAPAALWVIVGLAEEKVALVLLASAIAALCREEAGLVLLALLPFAIGRGARVTLALLVGAAGALALPLLVWGHLFQLGRALPFADRLAAIADGAPLVVYPEQGWFGLLGLLCALPALRAPRLLLPALGAFGLLTVFVVMEPAAPEQDGLHYLAVVHPLLIGALAWGIGPRGAAPSLLLALALAPWAGLRQIAGLFVDDPRQAVLAAVPAEAGVLCDPALTPPLSFRAQLYVRGNLGDGAELEAALAQVDRVLLEEPPDEALAAALVTAGFVPDPPTGPLWTAQRQIGASSPR